MDILEVLTYVLVFGVPVAAIVGAIVGYLIAPALMWAVRKIRAYHGEWREFRTARRVERKREAYHAAMKAGCARW